MSVACFFNKNRDKKTRGMKLNDVFYFQTVEIQWFAKCEMKCDYLLDSVNVCNFATEVYPYC